MGIDVYLVDELHHKVSDKCVLDPRNLLKHILEPPLDKSFQCLRFIDPYCDTVFNNRQMDQLIEELDRIEPMAKTTEEREMLKAIRNLARECKAEYHLYLKFVGD